MADEPVESYSAVVVESTANGIRQDAVKPITAGVFGAGLTALAIGGLIFVVSSEPINSLGFNALVGTAILSIGLIALIVLSRAVGISEPAAALGLPPGSIRALLALGLAIVFVSVASWSLGGLFDPVGQTITKVEVSRTDVQKYRDLYPATEFMIGETSVPKVAGSIDEKVIVTVSVKKNIQANGMLDLAKQILTITATVLVTVVGFYFGSNSSSEAVRNLRETLAELNGGSGSVSNADVAGLKKTMQQITGIETGMTNKLTELGDDPIAPLAAAVKEAGPNDELERQLVIAQKALVGAKAAAQACTASISKAKDAFNSVRVNASATELMQTGVGLNQCLADAEKANQNFDNSIAEFLAARNAILQGSAKG